MIQWSLDNAWQESNQYDYAHPNFAGLSFVHYTGYGPRTGAMLPVAGGGHCVARLGADGSPTPPRCRPMKASSGTKMRPRAPAITAVPARAPGSTSSCR